MKTISEYTQYVICEDIMNEVDMEIISESLQEPHLLQLAKWLKDARKILKDNNEWINGSTTFGGLLTGYAYVQIAWDKVTEADMKFYKKGDKDGIKDAGTAFKNNDKYASKMVFFVDDDDKIQYLANCNSQIIVIHNGKTQKQWSSKNHEDVDMPIKPDSLGYYSGRRNWHPENLTNKKLKEFANLYDFYVLDIDKFAIQDKRNQRWNNRQGSIEMSPASFIKIARENVERYKKIIMKHKAEKAAKIDDISNTVKDMVNKILDLTTKVMANPKNADLESRIHELIALTHSERHYVQGHGRTPGYYSGTDGLLKLYNQYCQNVFNSLQGYTYTGGEKGRDDIRVKMDKVIEKINTLIAEIESKMA